MGLFGPSPLRAFSPHGRECLLPRFEGILAPPLQLLLLHPLTRLSFSSCETRGSIRSFLKFFPGFAFCRARCSRLSFSLFSQHSPKCSYNTVSFLPPNAAVLIQSAVRPPSHRRAFCVALLNAPLRVIFSVPTPPLFLSSLRSRSAIVMASPPRSVA